LTHLTGDQKTGKFFAVAMLSDILKSGKISFLLFLAVNPNVARHERSISNASLLLGLAKTRNILPLHDTEAEQAALTAIQVMITRLTQLWPRTDSNQWDLPKIHEARHYIASN
jgi:hypothetical protein